MGSFTIVFEIIIAILFFGLIIFIHELGHFITAKLMKIQVNEFSLGMGPLILQFGKKETKYSWRLFPLGGYCAMEGEDTESNNPNAFSNKNVWKRILVVIAGVIMNFILGFILILIAVGLCTKPEPGEKNTYFCSTTISEINQNSLTYKCGLRKNDKFLKINHKTIMTDLDLIYLLQNDSDGSFDITVKRIENGKNKTIDLKNIQFETIKDKEGVSHLNYNFSVYPIKKTLFSTISRSIKLEYSYTVLIWRSLGSILSGEYGLNDLSGPVGATDIMVDAVDEAMTSVVKNNNLDGLYTLLMLIVLLTVNVGLFNILPLPALDGGRLLFLLIELIIRKKVPAKYENLIHTIGFIILILFSLVITYNDVVKTFQK